MYIRPIQKFTRVEVKRQIILWSNLSGIDVWGCCHCISRVLFYVLCAYKLASENLIYLKDTYLPQPENCLNIQTQNVNYIRENWVKASSRLYINFVFLLYLDRTSYRTCAISLDKYYPDSLVGTHIQFAR